MADMPPGEPGSSPVGANPAGSPAGSQGAPKANCCGRKTAIYIIKTITICCIVAAGLFSCNQMIYYDGDGAPRWHLIYFYTTFLAIFVMSSELNLLRHRVFRQFTGFLCNNTGRGITLLFMGGALLLNGTAGLIIGICCFVAGLMNLFSWCFFPELRGQNDQALKEALEDQKKFAAEQEKRQRI